MSDRNQARRTTAEVVFGGTDITSSIRSYFLSMTYTDNEEDEADDLQIKLEDRDSIWLEKWLNDAIQAAASSAPTEGAGEAEAKTYKVTPSIGLNVRTGPGTSYGKLGALPYGTEVPVTGISNGWATIQYSGRTAYVSAQYIKEVVGGQAEENSEASATTGLAIQAVFVRENWNNDGKDTVLDCGQFELDSIKASGPPATITIKATSLPFNAQIRQTEKTKAWEAYTLSGIAQEMAGANGMACLYESASDPYYERVEQYKVSDIKFLSQLCHDAGISLKATNNILVLFDQADYEAKDPTFTVKRGSGSYTKYDLSVGTADTKYTSCRVRYADPATGQVIEGTAYAEDYKADSKNNQQLEVTAKVASIAEAQTLAAKQLRLHNKYSRTATFTFPGDPSKVAGVTALGGVGRVGREIYHQAVEALPGQLRLHDADGPPSHSGGILMDSEKILSRLVQIGTVSDVDNGKRRARVILKETGHTSGWLCVLATPPFIPDYNVPQRTEFESGGSDDASFASHKHDLIIKPWMPKVNDQVLVLYLPVFNGDGFILGGI